MSESINEIRALFEEASRKEEETAEVFLPVIGRTFIAKKLYWAEADSALQSAAKPARGGGEEMQIDIVRYNRSIFAHGIHIRDAASGDLVRVFNPKSEDDLRKIERLPRDDVKAGVDAVEAISKAGNGAVEEAKNDSSETGILNSPTLSPSDSDAPTLQTYVAA